MTHELVGLPAFSCLGLERTGPVATCHDWVPGLWKEFLPRAGEIRSLARGGAWGLMSDPQNFLAHWCGEEGTYLAGFEVARGTEPFGDWKVWNVPASCWMKIPTRMDQYEQALEHMRTFSRTSPEWKREGALHEFYPESFVDPARDTLFLMAPLVPRTTT